MADKLTDFNLPTTAYTAFDALSLKNLIKDRLNQKSFFTDQNYEGSNLSSMIDVVAYSYHVLLFYLNQTSSESTFTETELYENINRIVKIIDYKPVGQQSANLSFKIIIYYIRDNIKNIQFTLQMVKSLKICS